MNSNPLSALPRMLALVVRVPSAPRSPGFPQRADPTEVLLPFTSADLRRGRRLAVDVLLEDHTGVTAVAEVEWLEALPGPGSSRIGMGLRLVGLEHADPDRLRGALSSPEPRPRAPADPAGRGADTELARLSARVVELRGALAALVEAREVFLGAMHAAEGADVLLPEEDRYVAAFRSARVALQERE